MAGAAQPWVFGPTRWEEMGADQAHWQEMEWDAGAKREDLAAGEEVRVVGSRAVRRRLRPRVRSDRLFPWRDPGDPVRRAYAPFADADGPVHPAVTVTGVVLGPPRYREVLQRIAADRRDPRLAGERDWQRADANAWMEERFELLARDVRALVEATLGRPGRQSRVVAQPLAEEHVPDAERMLVGQYGVFLTAEMLARPPGQRPLLSAGQVLGLYPGAVLEDDGAVARWRAVHPEYPDYAIAVPGPGRTVGTMAAEGFAGTVAFANTRVRDAPGRAVRDLSVTGINALFVPFQVRLTDRDGGARTQSIMALAGLDNLYGAHNRSGMVIADYGEDYVRQLGRPRSPEIKPDPDGPAGGLPGGAPALAVASRRAAGRAGHQPPGDTAAGPHALPRGAGGRPGDGARVERAWAAARERLAGLPAGLGAHPPLEPPEGGWPERGWPGGVPGGAGQALADFARAWQAADAAYGAWAQARDRPGPAARQLRAAVDGALRRLAGAQQRLAAAGITSHWRAWPELSRRASGRRRGGGLPGGAMGVEAERHNVRLFLPGGERLPAKTVLLRSGDGLVRVVVDNGKAWLGENGVLYASPQAMEAGGVAADPQAGRGGFRMSVPETVTAPWAVLAEPGRPGPGAVLARIRDVDQRWERAPATRLGSPPDSRSLAELFPGADYEITREFRDVRVVRLQDLFDGAPLYLQLSVGVPLGGGVLAALAELKRGADPGAYSAEVLSAAARFGWQVADRYMNATAGGAPSPEAAQVLTPGWDVAGAVTVAEVMALAFVQLSAVLDYQAHPEGPMKAGMVMVARQSLYEIWAELGPRLQAFCADRADDIRELFAKQFWDLFPDFDREYLDGESSDLWNVPFYDEDTDVRIGTVGRLFDEILRPAPEGERIGPEVFDIGRADSGGLDRSRGRGPGMPLPLVVLEMRDLGQSKYDAAERPETYRMIDDPMMADTIERMTGMARRGEAAAEFARQLPTSPEGRLVRAWLGQVAAALRGAERDGAAQILRQAAGLYLDRFPGDSAALNLTLAPFTEWLGVAGLVQADGADPAPPALAGMLLGAGHQAAEPEITRVIELARRLGMPAGGEGRWFADLAREVGLHDPGVNANVAVEGVVWPPRTAPRTALRATTRLFRLLVLATSVFDDGSVGREGLANLRRLVDTIGAARRAAEGGRRAEVTLAGLQAEYRLHYGLGDGAPVSMQWLRELVDLTGQVNGMRHPWGRLAAEVAVPAFGDGSLGLPFLLLTGVLPVAGEGGWAYRAPAWAVAAALAGVVQGRPFVIRPVLVEGAMGSHAGLAVTISRVHELVAALTGGDPRLAGPLAVGPGVVQVVLDAADEAGGNVLRRLGAHNEARIDEQAEAAAQAEYRRVMADGRGAAARRYERALRDGVQPSQAAHERGQELAPLEGQAGAAAQHARQQRRDVLTAAGAAAAVRAAADAARQRELAGDLAVRLREPLAEVVTGHVLAGRQLPAEEVVREWLTAEQAVLRQRQAELAGFGWVPERFAALDRQRRAVAVYAAREAKEAVLASAQAAAQPHAEAARARAESGAQGLGLAPDRIAARGAAAAAGVIRRAVAAAWDRAAQAERGELDRRLAEIAGHPDDPRDLLTAGEYRPWQHALARAGRARDTVSELHAHLDAARQARRQMNAAGRAVAGVYGAVTGLPPGWVADIQLAGGLWIRPLAVTAAARAWANGVPPAPARGLILIGAPGHQVPEEVWQAVRQALKAVPAAERGALRAQAIGAAAMPPRLAGLVDEQVVTDVPAPLAAAASWSQPFRPALLSPALEGVGVGDLTEEQIGLAAEVAAGLPGAEVARVLGGLPAPQRGHAESWPAQIRAAAPQAALAGRYLAGDLLADLPGAQQRQMVADLAQSVARPVALRLLAAAGDGQLGEMFTGGPGMLALLGAAFPPGDALRGGLEDFLAARFDGGRPELAAGRVVPQGQPGGQFSPGLIHPDLAALRRRELTKDELNRAGKVLAAVTGEAILGNLAQLPPVQQARARWWLRDIRQAVSNVAQARGHLTRDPRFTVPLDRLPVLISELARGPARWAALRLLQAADDGELSVIFADGPGMVQMMAGRFARGRAGLQAGHVVPRGQLAGTFTPALIGPDLAGLDPAAGPPAAEADRIAAAIGQRNAYELAETLLRLPGVPRARAAWWLTAARVAVHTQRARPPNALEAPGITPDPDQLHRAEGVLDITLDLLYRDTARQVPDAARLRQVTVRPTRDQVQRLRRALDPPRVETAGGLDPGQPAAGAPHLAGTQPPAGELARWVRERTGRRPARGGGERIDRSRLMRLAGEAVTVAGRWLEVEARRSARGPLQGVQEACLTWLEALAGLLFEHGIASGATLDDRVVASEPSMRRLLGRPGDWTPIPDWDTLLPLVEGLGVGGAALVVEGRPGAIGHAFAIVNTAGGLYLADPQNGGVSDARQVIGQARSLATGGSGDRACGRAGGEAVLRAPFRVRALLVDAAGRARGPAPGTAALLLATRSSAAAAAVTPGTFADSSHVGRSITDPPDPRVGALGFEAETDIVVLPPGNSGSNLPLGMLVARNEIAGYQAVTEYRDASIVIEVVTKPMSIRGDRRKWDWDGIVQRISRDLAKLAERPAGAIIPVAEFFRPEEGWQISPAARGLNLRLRARYADVKTPLWPQYSIGVPLTELYRLMQAEPHGRELEFGNTVARMFVEWSREADISSAVVEMGLLDEVDSVAMLRGFMALVYSHVVAHFQVYTPGDHGYLKNQLNVALRTPLAVIRESLLPEEAKRFLEENAEDIRAILRAKFLFGFPQENSFSQQYYEKMGEGRGELLDLELDSNLVQASVGVYLDNALVATPAKIIDQFDACDIGPVPLLDDNEGELPVKLLVVELRRHGECPIGPAGLPGILQALDDRTAASYERAARVASEDGRRHAARLMDAVRILGEPSLARDRGAKALVQAIEVMRDRRRSGAGAPSASAIDDRVTARLTEALLDLADARATPSRRAQAITSARGAAEAVRAELNRPETENLFQANSVNSIIGKLNTLIEVLQHEARNVQQSPRPGGQHNMVTSAGHLDIGFAKRKYAFDVSRHRSALGEFARQVAAAAQESASGQQPGLVLRIEGGGNGKPAAGFARARAVLDALWSMLCAELDRRNIPDGAVTIAPTTSRGRGTSAFSGFPGGVASKEVRRRVVAWVEHATVADLVEVDGGWLADGAEVLWRQVPQLRDGWALLSEDELAGLAGRALPEGASVPVAVHGNGGFARVPVRGPGGVTRWVGMGPEQVARMLEGRLPGDAVVALLSCAAGALEAPFVRGLAVTLGRDVLAAQTDLLALDSPAAEVLPGDGVIWQLFRPDGSV